MVALLIARHQQSRALRDLEQTSKDLGEITVQRWRVGDARADQLIALTETLTRLTWGLLAVTIVTLMILVCP
jgi:hypothetical protein